MYWKSSGLSSLSFFVFFLSFFSVGGWSVFFGDVSGVFSSFGADGGVVFVGSFVSLVSSFGCSGCFSSVSG